MYRCIKEFETFVFRGTNLEEANPYTVRTNSIWIYILGDYPYESYHIRLRGTSKGLILDLTEYEYEQYFEKIKN